MLNQLLGGHYLIAQNLGEGGLAKTYIAEDHHRPGHPRCVVKLLKPGSKDSEFLPIARRLFNQEAEILEKLGKHDQIPRLLAYFEENQEFYLVQELIEGHTLSMEIQSGQHWSEIKVIEMLLDVLPLLKFVHDCGVIHRDIKPSNLIRRETDSRLVLIDFGAVKQILDSRILANAPLKQRTISIGTQEYMPMEQMRGKPRFNSDIYALGMIAIQAMTGKNPLDLHEDDNGELIWQDSAQVSEELAMVLNNMVRYDFSDRYQSAADVLKAVKTLANQRLITSPGSVIRQANPISVGNEEKTHNQISLTENLLAPSPDSESVNSAIFLPKKTSTLIMGAGLALAFVSMYAGYSYIDRRNNYLNAQRTLAQIEALNSAEKYQECSQEAQAFPRNYSQMHTEAQILLHECQQAQVETRIAEARKLAEQSERTIQKTNTETRRQAEQQKQIEAENQRLEAEKLKTEAQLQRIKVEQQNQKSTEVENQRLQVEKLKTEAQLERIKAEQQKQKRIEAENRRTEVEQLQAKLELDRIKAKQQQEKAKQQQEKERNNRQTKLLENENSSTPTIKNENSENKPVKEAQTNQPSKPQPQIIASSFQAQDAIAAIQGLYNSLSQKEYRIARSFFVDPNQLDPQFFNQFTQVTVTNLQVTEENEQSVTLVGTNTYHYPDGSTKTEKRSFTLTQIDNYSKITKSEPVN